MFSISTKIEKESKISLILNVQSLGVAASLVLHKKGNLPKVIFSTFESLNVYLLSSRSTERSFLNLIAILEKVIHKVSTDGVKHLNFTGFGTTVHEVFVILSPFWHLSAVKDVHVDFKEEEALWAEDIADLLNKEAESFVSRLIEHEHKEKKTSDLEVFEKQIMKFALNGYTVANPYGVKCNNADLSLFFSASHSGFLNQITSAIHKQFLQSEIFTHSLVFSCYVAIRDRYPDKDDFILVIISAENTEISIVRRDKIAETVSFPLGEGMLIKEIMKRMPRIDPSVAVSILRMKGEKSLLESTHDKISDVFAKIEAEWLKLFSRSLLEISNQTFLPREMFICGENVQSGSFFSSLISEDFEKIKRKVFDWKIVAIDDSLVSDFVSKDSTTEILPIIAVSSYFANRNFETKS
jgi:hypothetical protein